MVNAVVVILAAGPATRMRTGVPKALHRVCGRALLEYALDAAAGLEPAGVAVVVPGAPAVAALVGERALCVASEEGAAQGLARSLARLPGCDAVVLLPCDLPQLETEHLRRLLEHLEETAAPAVALRVGGVDTGAFAARRDAALAVNGAAPPEALFPQAHPLEIASEPLVNVDTRADQARAERLLRRKVAGRLMDEGVTLMDPDSTWVDATVRVGADTVVYPWSVIEGHTELGRRCVIGPHAHLVNCVAGDDVVIEASVVRDSRLGTKVRVGPFANIRPGCEVGDGAKVGDFVELKNARMGARVSVAHLAYVGDAAVGEEANIGAGVITCNYDVFRKQQTTIGPNAFIGSNSVLIAPVVVGPGAYVAAHSVINQDVPEDALGIARCRQENKPGWARRKRQGRRKD